MLEVSLPSHNTRNQMSTTYHPHVLPDLLVKQGAYGEELTNDNRLESGRMIVVVFSEVFKNFPHKSRTWMDISYTVVHQNCKSHVLELLTYLGRVQVDCRSPLGPRERGS